MKPRLPAWLTAEIRPVLVFTGAGYALWAGTCILVRRCWARLGERYSLWERLGGLAVAGYLVGYGAVHAPRAAQFAVPGAVVTWCVAAWWAAPPAPAEEPFEVAAPDARDAFVRWLLDLIGDRPGIHLRELYPAMRQLPGHEGRSDPDLRAALRTLGVPVKRSLRIGGVAGRSGVARAALEALPSPVGELDGEPDGDAGQAVDSPGGESAGERLESA
ncbi:hypothetical protein [Streptomyces sp. NPDC127038]|uniref:hypothetical protein n=1 Tax=Streptomyces sp. NPDC127038 TaxID=3347114 RepID=UPI003654D0D6